MVKQLHFKPLLLMFCMLIGMGNAWADTATFNPATDVGTGTDRKSVV